jgi:hypothetical protein
VGFFGFSVYGIRRSSVFGLKEIRFMEEPVQKSRSFKDLEVWKLAVGLAKEMYLLTPDFLNQSFMGSQTR